eukprot:m.1489861 g.1489861  ORF g.1489861 m.1489861 type:complete len:62 (+) comp25190_c0_seq32:1876-2061(+)
MLYSSSSLCTTRRSRRKAGWRTNNTNNAEDDHCWRRMPDVASGHPLSNGLSQNSSIYITQV